MRYGYTEAMVREHSPEWLDDTLAAVVDQEVSHAKLGLSTAIQGSFVGGAAAFNGGEHHDQMLEVLNELATSEDGSAQTVDEQEVIVAQMAAFGGVAFERVEVTHAPDPN